MVNKGTLQFSTVGPAASETCVHTGFGGGKYSKTRSQGSILEVVRSRNFQWRTSSRFPLSVVGASTDGNQAQCHIYREPLAF